jgi:chemotaxis protein methyltransferase CheR
MVEDVSGNVVPATYLPFLAQAAEARVRATGHLDLAGYVASLKRGALAGEWSALLPLVTVNESYFFRTPQHFAALSRTLLPRLLAARSGSRRLRVWSAGCARGEEPATLAIVLAETAALVGWDWRVLATDVDEAALAAARRGDYGDRAVAQVPATLRDRYLIRRGELFELAPAVRSHLEYGSFNLVRDPFPDPGGPFDVVFLRNVLIYFRLESQRRVAAAVAATLAPDGCLFVGPAETLWQISDELEPVDLGDCFCYRRSRPPTPGTGDRAPGSVGQPRRGGAAPPRPQQRPGQQSQRTEVQGLGLPVPGPRSPVPVVRGTRERLTEAAYHLVSGRVAEAVALLDQALAADPGEPEAHALEGLVHERSGRMELAIASFRAALYLHAGLYQVRLLLADTLRRLGWEERARAEYSAVLARLAGGDARELSTLAALPLPDRSAAARRAHDALRVR